MGSIGMPELIVIFLVILMLFGSKRLPELARGLGKGIREFKKATNELKSELDVEPMKREFEQEIKGNLDEIKNDLDKTIHSAPQKPEDEPAKPQKLDEQSSESKN